MTHPRTIAFGVAMLIAAPLFAELPRLRPGQYETQTELAMPGRDKTAPRKKLQCVTADSIKDFSRNLSAGPREENCTRSDYKESASAVSYTQTCAVRDGSSLTMKANITFPTDETFRAIVVTSSTGGEASAASALYRGSTITITAKRVGDCTK